MKKNFIVIEKYFWFSTFIHLIVVLFFIIHFVQKKKYLITISPSIPSYIYHQKMQSPSTKKTITQPVMPKKIIATQISTNHANKKSSEDLLKILHETIAQQQTYPEDAIALRQSGIVTIGFTLYPDGKLENISLLKSSHIESLDMAALSAVHTIHAVPDAQIYLKKAHYFAVDVIFQ